MFHYHHHTFSHRLRLAKPELAIYQHAIEGLAEHGLIDPAFDPDLRLLSRMLVVMRLVAPDGNEPPEKSRALVAALCGHEGWDSLLAAHDEARQRVSELWSRVKEGR